MTLRNIVANYFGKLWSFLSIYLFVPLYIKLLGIEAYGVINFYTVLLSILMVADMGLSATLSREVAKTNDKKYQSDLLVTIERIYIVIIFGISIVLFFCSRIIAETWMKSNSINIENLILYVRLISFGLLFHLLSLLYHSGLMGLQKQVKSNVIQIGTGIFRQGIVLIPLFFIPTLEVFFIWQILINFVALLIVRFELWKTIGQKKYASFKPNIFKITWKFTAGMMIMSLIAAMNSQMDKLIVGKLLTLKEFGYYSLASIFSQTPSIIIMPIAIAILPKLTSLVGNLDENAIRKYFNLYTLVISFISTLVTVILFIYSSDFISLWTGDYHLTPRVSAVAKFLLIGGYFLSLQYMPFHLAIANGHTRTSIILGSIMALSIGPIMYYSVSVKGVIGATYPWIILNFLVLIFLTYKVIGKFLKVNPIHWMLNNLFLPIILGVLISSIFIYFPCSNGFSIEKILLIIIYSLLYSSTFYFLVFKRLNYKFQDLL